MDHYKITWTLHSAIETPLHSDTIFGHLCWALATDRSECLNEIDIGKFLEDMRQPRLILSSAFPQGALPLPVLSPPYEKLSDQLSAALAKRKLRKDAKTRKFLPLEVWTECRADYDHSVLLERNERIQSFMDKLARSQEEEMVTHNSINRITGTTVKGEASLYSEPATFYQDGTVFESYLSTDYFTREQLETLFMNIEISGFGRNKYTGRGRFSISVDGWDPAPVENPNAWLLLSNMVPAEKDPAPFAYTGLVKYGKLGGSYAAQKTNPFKKPLFMLQPGSVFLGPKAPTGTLVTGIHPDDDKIVQHAYALCLGFRMKGGGNG